MCAVYFFENKGVEFLNIVRFLCDPVIVNHPHLLNIIVDSPSSSVIFSMPMVTYKLTPRISTKFFNFNKFVNNLDLDSFLTKPDSLPCKCSNSPFVDRYHKHK